MKNNIIIDNEKLKRFQGIEFTGETAIEDCLCYMQSILYYLKTHNKQYTNDQYNKILTIDDILSCFHIE